VSESGHNGSNPGARRLPNDPHGEFEELCALSTTSELTADESARLETHLAHCERCRQRIEQYEGLIATAIPAIGAELQRERGGEQASDCWSIDLAEEKLMQSLRSEPAPTHRGRATIDRLSIWKTAWKYPLAAAILGAFSLVFYQAGRMEGHRSVAASQPRTSPGVRTTLPANTIPIATASTQTARAVLNDEQNSELRDQLKKGKQERDRLREQVSQLDKQLAETSAALNQSVQERAELGRELGQVQANAESLQTKLSAIGGQSSEDNEEILADKTKIDDLNRALEDKGRQIAREEELLSHDRDIRNLIGARNLYIAEIYDVGKSGDTQKPFGRIFYTKDRSLIFYGYDLDQQRGLKKDASFQAWGRRGADDQHDVSLGLLYQDDAANKRWVLKFNDPKTIGQLDAVFITAEPEGGSQKPTGKPLLFTYLRLDPNHP
jgi:hypothetical protein